MNRDNSIQETGAQPFSDKVRELEEANRRLRDELQSLTESQVSLMASERKYRALVHSSIDGICILQDQILTFANPRLGEMMECDPRSLIGTSFADHLAAEELERTLGLYRRMTSHEFPPQHYETVLVSRQGVRIDVGVSASMLDLDGVKCVLVMVRDIAGQKRAHQTVIENERLDAVRAVARGVGNNFANILNVINSYAASIADSFLPNTRPHESAMKILDAARHASNLTKRLLGVVRVSGSETGVHVVPVAVPGVIQKAYELIAPTLKERGITFDFQGGNPELYALADADQVLDVLMNIFLNGADAMPHGGSLVVCLTEVGRRAGDDRGGDVSDQYLELSVRDSGIGMSAEQVARVFEPFFSTKKDREAFGLGLSVAQSMVKGWGGWIAVSSEVGQGTCVRIVVPRVEPPSGQDFTGRKITRTVLLVEDNTVRRRMMAQVLLSEGHTVIEAGNGEEAITLYNDRPGNIDLTVLDWIMPGVDGSKVLEVIHTHAPEERVLMISGFSRDYVRSQIRMGAWSFLQKPFSEDQFRAAVRKSLDQ